MTASLKLLQISKFLLCRGGGMYCVGGGGMYCVGGGGMYFVGGGVCIV